MDSSSRSSQQRFLRRPSSELLSVSCTLYLCERDFLLHRYVLRSSECRPTTLTRQGFGSVWALGRSTAAYVGPSPRELESRFCTSLNPVWVSNV
ncbi:hypothetical protein CLOM_g7103 [Closterium sp. NIES-68]|nr:hypothetical protein CLOM_g7103 [Closterium sp. NIES-68]GJP72097.1 hypothetical protein CLOP_g2864 [Closterium sp. NIES-67]